MPACLVCGEPGDPDRDFALYLTAESGDPVSASFCSEACEDQAVLDAPPLVATCDRCGRDLLVAMDGVDLRIPQAYNVLTNGDTGEVLCLRCAGVDRERLGDLADPWELGA
ncbi:protein of unknown function [Candidatus Hydrogenisulfobacillus filiaventi]|uniref:Uncharacterized protein n=1 Tax=Candidatus Hydrogenisulfobacillus filiaventi TaxID=2707344 RepID=A0A6F8ZJ46_9FIRM|nr:protein of unknown function [Candidatus Hydrogenisulfobacillus filiaventi]